MQQTEQTNKKPQVRLITQQDRSINSFLKQNQYHTQARTVHQPQTLNQQQNQQNLKIQSNPNLDQLLSITQKQIMSHKIISDVVNKRKKNTVQHHVNQISIQTRLYSLPHDNKTDQFAFDTIPPTNQYFASTASKKLKQINQRLNNRKTLADRYKEKVSIAKQRNSSYQSQKNKRNNVVSADQANKRVCVSGLVSYNFNSINARRSLGYIPDQPQQVQLAKRVQKSRNLTCGSLDRQQKIIRRNLTTSNMQKIQMQKAVVCDFHTPTQKFLKIIKQQRERDKAIYGQRMQKLDCIKQYMQKQKQSYQNSTYIVQSVLNSVKNKKKQAIKKQKRQKSTIDDQQLLQKRRKVMQKKKLVLRHLYFTQ